MREVTSPDVLARDVEARLGAAGSPFKREFAAAVVGCWRSGVSSHRCLPARGSMFLPGWDEAFPRGFPAPICPNLLDYQIGRCFLARCETFETLNEGRYTIFHSVISLKSAFVALHYPTTRSATWISWKCHMSHHSHFLSLELIDESKGSMIPCENGLIMKL
jgi:hypothetical protein